MVAWALVVAFVVTVSVWVPLALRAAVRRVVGPPPAAAAPVDAVQVESIAAALRRRPLAAQDTDEHCGICLDELRDAVELLPCGHLFCAPCAAAYLRADRRPTLLCPADRAPVELILPSMRRRTAAAAAVRSTATDETNAQPVEATVVPAAADDAALGAYNARQRELRSGTVRGTLASVRWAAQEFVALPGVVQLRLVVAVSATLLYVVMPFDVLPEAALGVWGIVDDLLFCAVCLWIVHLLVRRVLG